MPLRFSQLARCQLAYGSAKYVSHAQFVAQPRVAGELGAVVMRDADPGAFGKREARYLAPQAFSAAPVAARQATRPTLAPSLVGVDPLVDGLSGTHAWTGHPATGHAACR